MTVPTDVARPGASPWNRLEKVMPWALLLAAGLPRLWALALRPLHHDEGSNAIFILRLLNEGVYRYDPSNYHGPLPFYLSALALALFGTTTFALRIVPAVLGSLMAPLAWSLRDDLGRSSAAGAALFIAWSPALVYYSRDNIHEIYFVFFTLGLMVALARATREGSWTWPLLAGAAAGCLLATKETAPLTLAAIGSGGLAGVGSAGAISRRRLAVIAAAALIVAAAFYSGGFRHLEDLSGPFRALRPWSARALGGEGHTKPWWYFGDLLARSEAPVLLLGLCGLALGVRHGGRPDRVLAIWLAITAVVYSTIPYKTPWLALNLVLPLALLAGRLVGAGIESTVRVRRVAGLLALAFAATLSLHDALRLALWRFDDEREPLVYVQTRREVLRLVERLEMMAAMAPEGHDLPIAILSPDYLPLNWYLRRFTKVSYHGHLVDDMTSPVVIGRSDEADLIGRRLGHEYLRRDYDLRPGVRLALFARRDLWQDREPDGAG